jgi:hypothetical protein
MEGSGSGALQIITGNPKEYMDPTDPDPERCSLKKYRNFPLPLSDKKGISIIS